MGSSRQENYSVSIIISRKNISEKRNWNVVFFFVKFQFPEDLGQIKQLGLFSSGGFPVFGIFCGVEKL